MEINFKMEGLLIFLVIVLGILIYLFFAPFFLEINSLTGLCRIRFHHLACATLIITDNSVKINLSAARWVWQIDLLKKFKHNRPQKKSTRPAAQNNLLKTRLMRVKALLKSFKINKLHLAIDSGNVELNGLLYPWFYWLSKHTGYTIEINFLGENLIVMEIENSIARILKALIPQIFTSKKQKSWTTLMNYSVN